MTTKQTSPKTISDLTLAELVVLLRATVTESLAEIVGYPDEQPEPCQSAASPAANGDLPAPTDLATLSGLSPKMAQKISNLEVAEFQWWLHYIVGEVGEDLIGDPDEGLEFTEEFVAGLLKSARQAKAAGIPTIPDEQIAELEAVVKGYGLAP